MMPSVRLIDSNHLGRVLKSGSPLYKRLIEEHERGSRFATCIEIVCEVQAGIAAMEKPERPRETLRRRLMGWKIKLWPLEYSTATLYGEPYRGCRAQGRILSQVDLMLAALARERRVTLLTADPDFETFDDIDTENWI